MARRRMPASAGNILNMLAKATASEVEDGRKWYANAHNEAVRIAEDCQAHGGNVTVRQAAAVLAALSPNNRWDRNVTDAARLCAAWCKGGSLDDVKVSTYGANKAKALTILGHCDPDDLTLRAILNGQKVVAFYASIMGADDTVCVDSHAWCIWRGIRKPIAEVPRVRGLTYDRVARSYVLAATKAAAVCGHDLRPAEVQAITWTTYRRLHGIAHS